jgi:hypothetical protein
MEFWEAVASKALSDLAREVSRDSPTRINNMDNALRAVMERKKKIS